MMSLSFAAKSTLPRASRRSAIVQANTLWQIAPRPKKATFFESAKSTVDLTGVIGAKRVCSVGARDYSADTIDYTLVDHGGVHLLFEAEGIATPLDSPSTLFVTDVDSECDITVDGAPLKKGHKLKLHPGAIIEMGEDASYVVLRNVQATRKPLGQLIE